MFRSFTYVLAGEGAGVEFAVLAVTADGIIGLRCSLEGIRILGGDCADHPRCLQLDKTFALWTSSRDE
jgi:hypothetical protein